MELFSPAHCTLWTRQYNSAAVLINVFFPLSGKEIWDFFLSVYFVQVFQVTALISSFGPCTRIKAAIVSEHLHADCMNCKGKNGKRVYRLRKKNAECDVAYSLSAGWNFVAGSAMRPSSLQRCAVAVKRSGANLGSLDC